MTAETMLYGVAIKADMRYSDTIKSHTGKTRWTLTDDEERILEIREAYHAKVNADEAWLNYMRTRTL